jgi:hypothetical protein
MDGRVLDPLDLADSTPVPAYWRCLWDSNPPTYYSSPSSYGSPSKLSMVAEAAAAAAYPFESDSTPNPDRKGGDQR